MKVRIIQQAAQENKERAGKAKTLLIWISADIC